MFYYLFSRATFNLIGTRTLDQGGCVAGADNEGRPSELATSLAISLSRFLVI
ncbi:unannotated protein [freshwater metagenome]|uniref:Unannotated protein n=1 Tax=freshwater metagenome TaxID=449393 RepID=A0A6J7AAX4_9ZZZZ